MKLGNKIDQVSAVLDSIVTHRDSAASIPAALNEVGKLLTAAAARNEQLTEAETAAALTAS